jgi:hypothetical protein
MFIANDSNYTFGQFLDVENGADIKSPVYTKCFTDTEALKGYRFVHDPEETDPEKCVSFSIYNETDSAALATAFGKFAAVSDLTSVMFRLDTEIVEGVLRDVSYYHVIVPVENIADKTRKYLVIKMTKEVELFPENYPYYELVSTFADAEPTSAEAPGGGGGGGSSELTTASLTLSSLVEEQLTVNIPLCYIRRGNLMVNNRIDFPTVNNDPITYEIPLYDGYLVLLVDSINVNMELLQLSGDITYENDALIITGDCEIQHKTQD